MTQGTGGYNLGGTPVGPPTQGGLAGGVSGLLGGSPTASGPPQQAYGTTLNNLGEQEQGFFSQGQNYTQNAPTITNPYQQASQAQLQATYGNLGANAAAYNQFGNSQALAQAQFAQANDAAIAQQMGAGANTRGPTPGMGAIQAAAPAQGAIAGAAGQAGATQAQVQQTGMQGQDSAYNAAGGLQLGQYGLEEQSAEAQAKIALANQAQQNAMQMGLFNLSQGYGNLQMQGLNQYTQGMMGAQGSALGEQGLGLQLGGQIAGGALGGLSTGLAHGATAGGGGGGGYDGGLGEGYTDQNGVYQPTSI